MGHGEVTVQRSSQLKPRPQSDVICSSTLDVSLGSQMEKYAKKLQASTQYFPQLLWGEELLQAIATLSVIIKLRSMSNGFDLQLSLGNK